MQADLSDSSDELSPRLPDVRASVALDVRASIAVAGRERPVLNGSSTVLRFNSFRGHFLQALQMDMQKSIELNESLGDQSTEIRSGILFVIALCLWVTAMIATQPILLFQAADGEDEFPFAIIFVFILDKFILGLIGTFRGGRIAIFDISFSTFAQFLAVQIMLAYGYWLRAICIPFTGVSLYACLAIVEVAFTVTLRKAFINVQYTVHHYIFCVFLMCGALGFALEDFEGEGTGVVSGTVMCVGGTFLVSFGRCLEEGLIRQFESRGLSDSHKLSLFGLTATCAGLFVLPWVDAKFWKSDEFLFHGWNVWTVVILLQVIFMSAGDQYVQIYLNSTYLALLSILGGVFAYLSGIIFLGDDITSAKLIFSVITFISGVAYHYENIRVEDFKKLRLEDSKLARKKLNDSFVAKLEKAIDTTETWSKYFKRKDDMLQVSEFMTSRLQDFATRYSCAANRYTVSHQASELLDTSPVGNFQESEAPVGISI